MKYSTFMSKTWLPSRCSRIARFVSGVIQFSLPISSSSPQGLFETFRPSLSMIGSNERASTSSTVAIATSLCLDDGLQLLDEPAIQLGPPVAEQVELVLAGDDVVLVARLLDVDVRDEEHFLSLVRLREPP